MTDEEFDDWLDLEPTEEEIACIQYVLDKSVRLGLAGTLDYDDQILLLPSANPSPSSATLSS